MINRPVIMISAMIVSGCSPMADPPLEICRNYILNKLKAPSTFQQIRESSVAVPVGNPKEWTVTITYDAANSYGVPIRADQQCRFPFLNGKADVSRYIDFDQELNRKVKAEVRAMEESMAVESGSHGEDGATLPTNPLKRTEDSDAEYEIGTHNDI